ncbi:hypothetical protein HanRHA438_Chr10g0444251 [Helianthus annuus]|nr:hypothetical protein HanRHA438_Chr10g0444251 [Helianthus annuus]
MDHSLYIWNIRLNFREIVQLEMRVMMCWWMSGFQLQRELNALLAATEKGKEIEACDEAICTSIRKINEHRKRRAFFLGFSQSLVEFIDALIESQGRDLKLAAGEASRNAEKEARAEFYNQPWYVHHSILFSLPLLRLS